MKQLTIVEMNDVSGAGIQQIIDGSQNVLFGLLDAAIGAVLLGFGASGAGGLQGGVTGNGSGGGILGFGVINIGIGSIWGAIQGAVTGAVWGAYVGADTSVEYIKKGVDAWFAGTIGGWTPN
ncbi:TPA: hypothetical protein R4Y08_003765 [Klebsiella quasipneumoniae subsp. quasipneumoniae]|nr:hypothetical protein [Klebsiella quasipneumoniae subsp. quasipneumoniae]